MTNEEADELARKFHETYEALAPSFGYNTRSDSAVPWAQVPEANRKLMVATVRVVAGDLGKPSSSQDVEILSRMWQAKTGVLLALIEDHDDPSLTERAIAAVNANWLTGASDHGTWDAALRAHLQATLDAATAAGLSPPASPPATENDDD